MKVTGMLVWKLKYIIIEPRREINVGVAQAETDP